MELLTVGTFADSISAVGTFVVETPVVRFSVVGVPAAESLAVGFFAVGFSAAGVFVVEVSVVEALYSWTFLGRNSLVWVFYGLSSCGWSPLRLAFLQTELFQTVLFKT